MRNTTDVKALGFDWPELEKVEADMDRLEADRVKTERRIGELRRDHQQAEITDRDAYAAALLAGKPEPKAAAVPKVEREQEETRRRTAALASALGQLSGERSRLMREKGPAWRREIVGKLPDAQGRAEAAGRELRAAVAEINALASLHDWIGAPEGGHRGKRPVGVVEVAGRRIAVDAVLDALESQASSMGPQERKSA